MKSHTPKELANEILNFVVVECPNAEAGTFRGHLIDTIEWGDEGPNCYNPGTATETAYYSQESLKRLSSTLEKLASGTPPNEADKAIVREASKIVELLANLKDFEVEDIMKPRDIDPEDLEGDKPALIQGELYDLKGMAEQIEENRIVWASRDAESAHVLRTGVMKLFKELADTMGITLNDGQGRGRGGDGSKDSKK